MVTHAAVFTANTVRLVGQSEIVLKSGFRISLVKSVSIPAGLGLADWDLDDVCREKSADMLDLCSRDAGRLIRTNSPLWAK